MAFVDDPGLDGLTILQILPALNEGGVEQSTVDMARYIMRHGGRAIVASSGGKRAADLGDAMHHTLPLRSKSPLVLHRNARALADLIAKERPDIIHVRSRAPAWSAWWACERLGETHRFVSTYHGVYSAGTLAQRWYSSPMRRGRVIIANSEFIADHLRTVHGVAANRIHVAPRGVDATFLVADIDDATISALRTDWSAPADTPLLALVGRLTRWKGQHVFLDALAHVRDLDWCALIVGSATSETYAAEIAAQARALGIADRVRLLGPRRDVPAIYAAATLAFTCSIEPEAFGRAAIEAMAMGAPVIATAHGGSLETVVDGETGWLVPPGDARALAATIRGALTNPGHLAAMKSKARAHVRARFTVDHCCAAETAAYRRLLARHTEG
jgi:glycosyltransferase involved in cell wall biosynthesis